MFIRRKTVVALAFLLLVFTFAAPSANAEGNEYKAIVKHLKTKTNTKLPMSKRFARNCKLRAGKSWQMSAVKRTIKRLTFTRCLPAM